MGDEYTFWVRGRICPDILAVLHPLRPVVLGPRTELRGEFVDQVSLHRIIARLEGLGVQLVALQRIPVDGWRSRRRREPDARPVLAVVPRPHQNASPAARPNTATKPSAVVRPHLSASAPVRTGPTASPIRFCTKAKINTAVARTPSGTTSRTTATAGPIAVVAVAPPSRMSTIWVTPGRTATKAVPSIAVVATAVAAGTSSRQRTFTAAEPVGDSTGQHRPDCSGEHHR
jgi:hypothetical protein